MIHLPAPTGPTAIIPTTPNQNVPDAQPTTVGNGPTFGTQVNGGIPLIAGNGPTAPATNPPVLSCLANGQVSANANPTNALFAAGLTSVLAQMSNCQLSAQAVLTVATVTPHNGN
jgi:hypothetical protein